MRNLTYMNAKPSISLMALLIFMLTLMSCTSTTVDPPVPILPVPTERQLAWHEMEQYAFVHFTINTSSNFEKLTAEIIYIF